jgi:MFS transporter, PPP family, 3-phenylpropionic acid transporter
MSDRSSIQTIRGIHFSYYASQAVIQPLLPLYFAHLGYSSQQIGSLLVLGPFIAILAQPLWGWLSDYFQAVKPILLGLWIMAGFSAAGLFTSSEFTDSLVFSILFQFFLLSAIPLLDSITLQTTEKSGSSYGAVRLWGSVGYTITALLSGLLLAGLGGISRLYVLYTPLGLLTLMLAVRIKAPSVVRKKISLADMGQLLTKRSMLGFLFIVFLVSLGHRMQDTFFSLHMQRLGAESRMIGWAWAIAAGGEIPVFALMNRLLSRYNGYLLLAVISSLYTVRWVLLAVITDPLILTGLQMLHAVTFAAFWATSIYMMVEQIPASMRSTGQALLSAVYMGLAGLLAGTLGGYLMDLGGGPVLYRAAAFFAFSAMGISAVIYIRSLRETTQHIG